MAVVRTYRICLGWLSFLVVDPLACFFLLREVHFAGCSVFVFLSFLVLFLWQPLLNCTRTPMIKRIAICTCYIIPHDPHQSTVHCGQVCSVYVILQIAQVCWRSSTNNAPTSYPLPLYQLCISVSLLFSPKWQLRLPFGC